MRNNLIITTLLLLSLGPPAWAQIVPPDAYNASTSTSGAFTGDDSLYAGNPGFRSRVTGTGSTIISYKRIVVTETSTFWGVTGNGTFNGGLGIGSLDWSFTVDPFDGATATTNPTTGSIANEQLTLTDSILRGAGFNGGLSEDWDVMLNPLDGEGFTLAPGEYYVSVWADTGPISQEWTWNELSTDGIASDITYIDALHAPGEFGLITDYQSFGFDMQTGDLGFDVWMTTVPAPGAISAFAVIAPFALRRRRR